jgi:hypothetical protein
LEKELFNMDHNDGFVKVLPRIVERYADFRIAACKAIVVTPLLSETRSNVG